MQTDNAATTPLDDAPSVRLIISAPPDATEVHDDDKRLLHRSDTPQLFEGIAAQVQVITVRVHGLQRSNGTCRRWVTVDTRPGTDEEMLEPEAVRQLAAALVAAADEIEARR
ncbi:hypothetical protein [Mycobacterium sp. SMC-2]|uniref:hypothetical protein n=1 Tax=Mycobacterium sp. SMC-2 TaxID=2857058 RepID=UPI0021B3DB78|nr:hypothetical protein [Mycobacterium sp. SMC-2]